MTLQEHIKTAKWLVKARKDLMNISCFACNGKRRNKADTLKIWKVVALIDHLKFTLDKVYFRTVDDATRQKLGDIYYKVD